DVVFNHTAEGDHRGPTLSLRGLDNPGYYALDPRDPARYLDYSGCGNSLDPQRPLARALVLDCLRYWAVEMRVDGFRFDLAPALGRGPRGFDPRGELLRAIADEPALAGCKLIAEPWDVGPGGYNLGRFPPPWAEWNDRFRDDVRRFWRGEHGRAGALATRLCGSDDVFSGSGRGPLASVNYVTAHDGFTLVDLVSYARKHNEENGEENRDGHGENFSHNHGVEGPTDDPAITEARARTRRALWATLLLAQGVPMISAGDELGRTQHGNNNAYCHDSPLGWLDWALDDARARFLEFARGLVALRREHPALRRASFLTGAPGRRGVPDVAWLRPDGHAMQPGDWAGADCFGYALAAEEPARALLILINASTRGVLFRVPAPSHAWRLRVDTAAGAVLDTRARAAGVAWVDGRCAVAPRSLLVLRDDPDDGCGRMRGEAR
ncbi:MAG: glycogen debranching enzyme GlgX, partial [Myxococcales bacterium]|nr:glycogen debranching enzyme GlgX [Myxococcales bacterium]